MHIGKILKSYFERNSDNVFQLVLEIQNRTINDKAKITFIKNKQINKLFDNYSKVFNLKKTNIKTSDFVDRAIYIPSVHQEPIYYGATFSYNDAIEEKYIWTSNSDYIMFKPQFHDCTKCIHLDSFIHWSEGYWYKCLMGHKPWQKCYEYECID